MLNKVKYWFSHESKNTPKSVYWINFLLVNLFFIFLIYITFSNLGYKLVWKNVWNYRNNFIAGFIMTILISTISLFTSLITGIFFGLAQRSKIVFLRIISHEYIELIRGTPLLVQVLIFYYVVANALGINNRLAVGIFIMSIFSGAYIAEIVRSGIESIGKNQLETAISLGFTRRQIYLHIIFPQVITRTLPPLTGQFANLIKDSSLLSIISIKEFTMSAREINAATFSTLESYLPLALGYLLITIPISALSKKLEKKYKYET